MPIPFDLPFETSSTSIPGIATRVRAGIVDGTRVLFTTPETVLVLTQGHPATASLTLVAASAASAAPATAPRSAPRASAALLPPPVDLRGLPATFTGTLPCADCAGIRYELNLFPDDSFFLRRTYAGRTSATGGAATTDTIGSWVLSSDRRVVVLSGDAEEAPENFAIRDAFTLRQFDSPRGRPSGRRTRSICGGRLRSCRSMSTG